MNVGNSASTCMKMQHRKQHFARYIMAAFWTQTRTSRPTRAHNEDEHIITGNDREMLKEMHFTLIFLERNNQPRSLFRATRLSLRETNYKSNLLKCIYLYIYASVCVCVSVSFMHIN